MSLGDLAPIVYDTLVGPLALLTPPSAFLSPYAKSEVFVGDRYHADEVGNHSAHALQFASTIKEALGWLPEFDLRIDRINFAPPFLPDKRTDPLAFLGCERVRRSMERSTISIGS